MNKQKTVDSKVLAILRECPETRYDDMQLILCYYNRYSYMRVGDLPLEDIVNNYKGYGLPCFGFWLRLLFPHSPAIGRF